ncbi:taste receptor type 2 member 42-like [Hyla sarda]|uniref:taste receptor type 2 member 42-like n=1 Tax=Hyla sarda TaxID=327740 RepID=UPI0024C3CFE6|nr:taste receptor type 2 member 42-like [Hyla sarda]
MDPGSPGITIGLSCVAAEVLVAMFTNIFIISIILLEFHRTKKLDTKDQIQMALKVSSCLFTTVVTYNEFSKVLKPELFKSSHPSLLFAVAIVYSMCSSTWLVTLQCFFYFFKIVNSKWAFIPWVKRMMDSSTSWQIVVVEVMSLGIGLLHLLLYRTENVSSTNSSDIPSTNMTPEEMIIHNYVTYPLLIVTCPSLLLSTISTIITAAFLRGHMIKMKDTNTTGELHQYNRAVRTLLRYLFLYCVFYVMMFLYYFSFFALHSIGYWINLILVFLFIPVVNVLQILGTPHLRTTWKEMMSYFPQCRKPNIH